MAMNASVFKEDPCSILMGEELNAKAYKTAVAFVPSMRMKVWKPKEGGRSGEGQGGSNEFCYMETDKYSYPTRGVCSADTLFDGKVPFIKSAFFDNKLEKTKTFPEDKCVFEIDRTKMTDAALNAFWTKINDLECTGQFVEYQKSNLTLTGELRSLWGQIGDQNGIKAQLTRDISSGNATLDQYRIVFGKLQWNIARVTTSNDDLLLKQDQVKAYIATIAADFGRFRASYEASSNLVNNNISNLTARIAGQNSTLATNVNNIDFIKKQIGYSNLRLTELKSAFSNIQIQYNQLYDTNKKLLVTLNAERGNLTGCQTTLADRTRTLEWYRVKVPEIKNEFNKNSALNNQCYTESLQCSSNLELCLSNQLALTGSNNALIIKYQKLVDLYDICMGVQSNLVAQSNALGGAIKDWLATHFICDFQVNGLKALDLKKETLQKTCRVADKATYDTSLMSAQSVGAKAAADQVVSCTADKNTLYTSVPVTAEAPVDPNSSKSISYNTRRVVTCPASYLPNNIADVSFCSLSNPEFGQKMCDTYLPGKNAKFADKDYAVINGTRWGYYCSYTGDNTDEAVQNKEILEADRLPPIFIKSMFKHDTVMETYWNDGRCPWVVFLITNTAWLNEKRVGEGNNKIYSTAPDWARGWKGNFFGTIKGGPFPTAINANDKLDCGPKKDFDYKSCSPGMVFGFTNTNGYGFDISCDQTVLGGDIYPLLKRSDEEGGITTPGRKICYGANFDTQVGDCCPSFRDWVKIPSGHMIAFFSNETIQDTECHIAVGPCRFFPWYQVNRMIAINTLTFGSYHWFFNSSSSMVNWSEIDEGKVYSVPNYASALCLAIPAWVTVETVAYKSDFAWGGAAGERMYKKYDKPGFYTAGMTAGYWYGHMFNGNGYTPWRFVQFRVIRQNPNPTGWVPPFKSLAPEGKTYNVSINGSWATLVP